MCKLKEIFKTTIIVQYILMCYFNPNISNTNCCFVFPFVNSIKSCIKKGESQLSIQGLLQKLFSSVTTL
jgi:hypothetical protein